MAGALMCETSAWWHSMSSVWDERLKRFMRGEAAYRKVSNYSSSNMNMWNHKNSSSLFTSLTIVTCHNHPQHLLLLLFLRDIKPRNYIIRGFVLGSCTQNSKSFRLIFLGNELNVEPSCHFVIFCHWFLRRRGSLIGPSPRHSNSCWADKGFDGLQEGKFMYTQSSMKGINFMSAQS